MDTRSFHLETIQYRKEIRLATLYLNGKNEGSIKNWNQKFSWADKNHRILIGLNYMGLFDDLACFNRALSQKEIESIYEHKKSLRGLLK